MVASQTISHSEMPLDVGQRYDMFEVYDHHSGQYRIVPFVVLAPATFAMYQAYGAREDVEIADDHPYRYGFFYVVSFD